MRIFFDTEFLEDGKTIEPISIGMVTEEGDEYYACFKDSDWDRINRDAWIKQHVLPQLPDDNDPAWKSRRQIAEEIIAFVGDHPEFFADFAAYDWICLCQLYGKMIHLPDTWPMFCRDIQQLKELVGIDEFPAMGDNEHNALVDARETKARFDMCVGAARTKGIKIALSRPPLATRLSKALLEGIAHARGEQSLVESKPRFKRSVK